MGAPRDAIAKAVCADCNNGWMKDMDNALGTLGPRLLKGQTVLLTRGKKKSLASWAIKTIFMLQLTHPRDGHFVISGEDYTSFHHARQPTNGARLWAARMRPPGLINVPALAFVEYRCDDLTWDEDLLLQVGLGSSLACTGYSAMLRVGHLVVAMLNTRSEELARSVIPLESRKWIPIWPAVGTRDWSTTFLPTVHLDPFIPGLRVTKLPSTESSRA